jgi:hypothetical protein
MRSIRVPLELTVRLVSVVEGVENTNACVSLLMLGRCIAMLPLTERFAAFCTHFSAPVLPGLPKDRPRTSLATLILGCASMMPGLRAMAGYIGGDGLDACERATDDFERRTVAANAATAGCR